MESNKGIARIVIYVLLLLIFIGLSVYSYILFYRGYGDDGRLMKELSPIINSFNSLNAVKNNKAKIKARFNVEGIKLTYIENKKKNVYIATYSKIADLKLLTLEYNSDDQNAKIVCTMLLEAISVYYKNNEDDLFKKITYDDLYKLNSNQGAQLTKRGNTTELKININTNLYENIKDEVFEPQVVKYITTSNLSDLKEVLHQNRKYNYYKDTLVLDIRVKNNTYEIYCSNNENNYENIYESIMSAVNIIDQDIYDAILNENLEYNKEHITDRFKYEIKPQFNTNDILAQGENLVKLTFTIN